MSPSGFEGTKFEQRLTLNNFDKQGTWLKEVVTNEHTKISQECWHFIKEINPSYNPIDWQRDLKSGFRWNAKLDFTKQGKLSKNLLGVDIKIPWELSRRTTSAKTYFTCTQPNRRKQ